MQELWKPIKGYEGIYLISNFGSIKSIDRVLSDGRRWRGRTLKLQLHTSGYHQVILYKNNKGTLFMVHRLVASAFIDNTNDFSDVNHLDENKLNNNVTNLEWCTRRRNTNYSIKRTSKNPYVGVSWHKLENKWQVRIFFNNKYNYLGKFTKKEDAIEASSKFCNDNNLII